VDALGDQGGRPDGSPVLAMLAYVERAFLYLSMASVAALGLLVASVVAGRALLGLSIPDDVVLVQELMILAIMLPLAYVTGRGGHIRVTIFLRRLSRRALAGLDLFGNLIGLALIGALAAAAWGGLTYSVATGAYYDGDLYLPEWPGKAAYFAGLTLFFLRLVAVVARDIGALRTGNSGTG